MLNWICNDTLKPKSVLKKDNFGQSNVYSLLSSDKNIKNSNLKICEFLFIVEVLE